MTKTADRGGCCSVYKAFMAVFLLLSALSSCVPAFSAQQPEFHTQQEMDQIDAYMSKQAYPYRTSADVIGGQDYENLPAGMYRNADGALQIAIDDRADAAAEEERRRVELEEQRKMEAAIMAFMSNMSPVWAMSPVLLNSPLSADTTAKSFDAAARRTYGRKSWNDYLNGGGRDDANETFGVINSGVVIPAMLLSGLNSDLPGHLVAQISETVYDSPTGRHVLIPQGSRLFGEYYSKVIFGQKRPMVRWQRLIFGDGSTLDLENMAGYDKSGYAGFKSNVDNHYFQMLGSATLVSVFAGLAMEAGKSGTRIEITEPTILVGDTVPVGTVSMWTTAEAPVGYLLCDGRKFDTALYPELAVLLSSDVTPDYSNDAGKYYIIKSFSRSIPSYQASASVYEDDGNAVAEEVSKTMASMSEKLLEKYIDLAPTLRVAPGYRFNVIVNREIALPIQQEAY